MEATGAENLCSDEPWPPVSDLGPTTFGWPWPARVIKYIPVFCDTDVTVHFDHAVGSTSVTFSDKLTRLLGLDTAIALNRSECRNAFLQSWGISENSDFTRVELQQFLAVLNNEYVSFSALGKDNLSSKKQLFELLSALCVYSPEGYNRAIDAFEHYKVRFTVFTFAGRGGRHICGACMSVCVGGVLKQCGEQMRVYVFALLSNAKSCSAYCTSSTPIFHLQARLGVRDNAFTEAIFVGRTNVGTQRVWRLFPLKVVSCSLEISLSSQKESNVHVRESARHCCDK